MTLKDLLTQLSALAEQHEDADVAIVTIDREFGIHSASYDQGELGMAVLIYTDEPG